MHSPRIALTALVLLAAACSGDTATEATDEAAYDDAEPCRRREPQIRQLAENIIAEQRSEIDQMTTWRNQWADERPLIRPRPRRTRAIATPARRATQTNRPDQGKEPQRWRPGTKR